MGGKKKYIEMSGSFTKPFICPHSTLNTTFTLNKTEKCGAAKNKIRKIFHAHNAGCPNDTSPTY